MRIKHEERGGLIEVAFETKLTKKKDDEDYGQISQYRQGEMVVVFVFSRSIVNIYIHTNKTDKESGKVGKEIRGRKAT